MIGCLCGVVRTQYVKAKEKSVSTIFCVSTVYFHAVNYVQYLLFCYLPHEKDVPVPYIARG